MSTKEIAGIMGCMEGTVKSRLYTARTNLKRELTSQQDAGKEAAF
jgi:RNA polymerase sigma-70 factor (ECF subfamily)